MNKARALNCTAGHDLRRALSILFSNNATKLQSEHLSVVFEKCLTINHFYFDKFIVNIFTYTSSKSISKVFGQCKMIPIYKWSISLTKLYGFWVFVNIVNIKTRCLVDLICFAFPFFKKILKWSSSCSFLSQ